MKNTILSIIRHVLTAVGGAVLAKNPDIDVTSAVGAIMTLIGLIWGATDEHRAENVKPIVAD